MKNLVKPLMLLLLFVFAFLNSVIVRPILAQDNPSKAVIVQALPYKPLMFKSINHIGEITTLGHLPIKFQINDQVTEKIEWIIWYADEIMLSPDQKYVAFSAIKNAEYRLFVYRVNGDEVFTIPNEKEVEIRWSPDSRGFVIAQTNLYNPSDHAFIGYFEVASKRIIPITPSLKSQFIRSFQWLDNEHLIFEMLDNNETTLEVLTLDGHTTALFNTDALPDQIYNSVCEREWSKQEQVIYFSVGCVGGAESVVLQRLYNVDLQGHEYLVISPSPDYLKDNIYQALFSLDHIENYDENTYLLQQEYLYRFEVDGAIAASDVTWQILRVSQNRVTSIYKSTVDLTTGFTYTKLSPDGKYFALATYQRDSNGDSIRSKIQVVNLQTGTLVRNIDVPGRFFSSIKWLDNHTFVYSGASGSRDCQCDSRDANPEVLLIDLSKPSVLDLTDQLPSTAWLFTYS